MAYMNQEKKKALAPQIKEVLKKYDMKGTLAVRHHSTLVLNIKEGKLDVIGNYIEKANPEYQPEDHHGVNPYWLEDHYTGEVCDFLLELKNAMNGCEQFQNHDRSDLMTDYHDVGWYIDINIGQWNKPYKLNS